MNLNFKDLRGMIRRWAPALIGIPAMLLLAAWFDVARFFLFGHHLFWIVGAILVIISLSQTPSGATQKRKGPDLPLNLDDRPKRTNGRLNRNPCRRSKRRPSAWLAYGNRRRLSIRKSRSFLPMINIA